MDFLDEFDHIDHISIEYKSTTQADIQNLVPQAGRANSGQVQPLEPSLVDTE